MMALVCRVERGTTCTDNGGDGSMHTGMRTPCRRVWACARACHTGRGLAAALHLLHHTRPEDAAVALLWYWWRWRRLRCPQPLLQRLRRGAQRCHLLLSRQLARQALLPVLFGPSKLALESSRLGLGLGLGGLGVVAGVAGGRALLEQHRLQPRLGARRLVGEGIEPRRHLLGSRGARDLERALERLDLGLE